MPPEPVKPPTAEEVQAELRTVPDASPPKFEIGQDVIYAKLHPSRVIGQMVAIDVSGAQKTRAWRYMINPADEEATYPIAKAIWVTEDQIK